MVGERCGRGRAENADAALALHEAAKDRQHARDGENIEHWHEAGLCGLMLNRFHADPRAIGHAQGQGSAIVARRAILDLNDGLEIEIEPLLLEMLSASR